MIGQFYEVVTYPIVGKPVIAFLNVKYTDENFVMFVKAGTGDPEEVKMIFTKHTTGKFKPKWISGQISGILHAHEDDDPAWKIKIVPYEFDGENVTEKEGGKSITIKVKDDGSGGDK